MYDILRCPRTALIKVWNMCRHKNSSEDFPSMFCFHASKVRQKNSEEKRRIYHLWHSASSTRVISSTREGSKTEYNILDAV